MKNRFIKLIAFVLMISLVFSLTPEGQVFAKVNDSYDAVLGTDCNNGSDSILKNVIDDFSGENQVLLDEDLSEEGLEAYELSATDEDFLSGFSFGNEDEIVSSPLRLDFIDVSSRYRTVNTLPMKYDLRKMKRTTEVKDQGKNGSCWAFATYAALESVLSKYDKYDFSEKHMRNKHGFDWNIYKGGNRDIATAYLASWAGPISEDDDPYNPVISTSPDGLDRLFDINEVRYLPDVSTSLDRIDIKEAIRDFGGVYTTIKMESFYENKEHNSYYNTGNAGVPHAVTIVGWNDYFSRKKFNTMPNSTGAWICKNSWGDDYMDGGYFYVSYDDVNIGKSNTVFIPKKKDENGHIYQYDPLGVTKSLGYKNGEFYDGYMANAFTSKRDETLHEIGIYNLGMFTEYTLYVANDIKSTSQLSSARVEVARGTFKFPGYYTVKLDKPIEIEAGKTFAVIGYMKSKTNKHPIPIEMPIANYSSKATAKKGVSFVSKKGSGWLDIAKKEKNTNVCIKAITTTGEIIADDEGFEDGFLGLPLGTQVERMFFAEGHSGYLKINHKGKLNLNTYPEGLENIEVKYSSSDEDIASVDKDGIIRPLAVGKTKIRAEVEVEGGVIKAVFELRIRAKDYEAFSDKEIEVVGYNDGYEPDPDEEADDVALESILVNKPMLTIKSGEECDLSEIVSPYPADSVYEFKYESLDKGVALVSDSGIVKGVSDGMTRIVISSKNDPLIKAYLKVNVVASADDYDIDIRNISVSKRHGGVFTVFMEAFANGEAYSGPATVTTVADRGLKNSREKESSVYFKDGRARISYNGIDFGVWRTEFDTKIGIKGHSEMLRYHFSKDSYSASYVEGIDRKSVVRDYGLYSVDDIKVSNRRGGVFTVTAFASKKGQAYSGLGIIDLSSEGKVSYRTVTFLNGKATSKYNGLHFSGGYKDFDIRVMVKNAKKEMKHSFR